MSDKLASVEGRHPHICPAMKPERCRKLRPRSACKAAFTLIELLIVIAIITILMAMLLPALQKAKKIVRLGVCASQLRQHGVAHASYAGDFDGHNPNWGGPNDYWGTRDPSSTYMNINWLDSDVLKSYKDYLATNNVSFFRCPVPTLFPYAPIIPAGAHDIKWHADGVAYAFLTGRKMNDPVYPSYNHDSRNSRNDPREIIMLDWLSKNTIYDGENTTYGTMWSRAIPYYNPHDSSTCTVSRRGSAHQLLADGGIVKIQFAKCLQLRVNLAWVPAYAGAVLKQVPSSPGNGPYYVWDGVGQ